MKLANIVDGGHRAVKYSRVFGVQKEVYNEGTHFVVPWFETPIIYDVRAKPRNVASLTGTKGKPRCHIAISFDLYVKLQMRAKKTRLHPCSVLTYIAPILARDFTKDTKEKRRTTDRDRRQTNKNTQTVFTFGDETITSSGATMDKVEGELDRLC